MLESDQTTGVVIVAAGSGSRAATTIPKQFYPLDGVSILQRSISAFVDGPSIGPIIVVFTPEHEEFAAPIKHRFGPRLDWTPGGSSRQASVLAGLLALKDHAPRNVLVHDAARPLVSPALIDRTIGALKVDDAVLPAVPVIATLKRSDDGKSVAETVSRTGLYEAQTPQGARFDVLLAAHLHAASAGTEFTDDVSLLEGLGHRVAMIAGDRHNIKVTEPDDFALAGFYLRSGHSMETRVGSGLDIHRFVPGSSVRLAEVDIPHDHALSGHSDADAALHVLTDALLGALAEGDIGRHFPPSDNRWRGEPSRTFLSFAAQKVAERGGRIVNLDLTLMCEAPKIGPHASSMRANIADICGISIDRVSVKATTAEKMGFVGRGEGLFAQAAATIEVPRKDDDGQSLPK